MKKASLFFILTFFGVQQPATGFFKNDPIEVERNFWITLENDPYNAKAFKKAIDSGIEIDWLKLGSWIIESFFKSVAEYRHGVVKRPLPFFPNASLFILLNSWESGLNKIRSNAQIHNKCEEDQRSHILLYERPSELLQRLIKICESIEDESTKNLYKSGIELMSDWIEQTQTKEDEIMKKISKL
jgi:hypothetical protein